MIYNSNHQYYTHNKITKIYFSCVNLRIHIFQYAHTENEWFIFIVKNKVYAKRTEIKYAFMHKLKYAVMQKLCTRCWQRFCILDDCEAEP